jgi:hypothetical protein
MIIQTVSKSEVERLIYERLKPLKEKMTSDQMNLLVQLADARNEIAELRRRIVKNHKS